MTQPDPSQEVDPSTGLPYTEEQRAARDAERAAQDAENVDKGDGPSSHETSGTFPAAEVAETIAAAAAEQDERNRQNAEQRAADHAAQHDQT